MKQESKALRTFQVAFRCTQSEKEQIYSHAAEVGLSIPDYICAINAHQLLIPLDTREDLERMRRELLRQKNNYNQIARQLNCLRSDSNAQEISETVNNLESVGQDNSALANKLTTLLTAKPKIR